MCEQQQEELVLQNGEGLIEVRGHGFDHGRWRSAMEQDAVREFWEGVRQHTRRRPSMVIGGVDAESLHFLAFALLEASFREFASGNGNRLMVCLHRDGSLTIADDGRGISVEPHAERGCSVLEFVLTTGQRLEGGREALHGEACLHAAGVRAGIALANIATAKVSWKGRSYVQHYHCGLATGDPCEIGPADGPWNYHLRLHPDPTIFDRAALDADRLAASLREFAFINKRLTVQFANECTGSEETFHFPRGVVDLVEHLNSGHEVLHPVLSIEDTVDEVSVEAALQYAVRRDGQVRCYANSIYNEGGGRHLDGLHSAVTSALRAYGSQCGVGKTARANDLRKGLTAVVSVRVPHAMFTSHSRKYFLNPEVEPVVASLVGRRLADFLRENRDAADRILFDVL